ncbi:response regulator transcription factor [Gordonia alkanivorans]|uniref:response regulator transcription factor n=1 Tax=Gordonia alkanivorans TaxID=84096 RepID=UPI00244A76B4|nr:response regulator transcription factor [Gordonia alkanivorans]MDH3043849.1 response regulator transcription factor [Gordonia alkanivorans]
MISVALVDDQPLFRSGIAMVINSQDDMAVVAEASTGATVVTLCRTHRPDVVLMDIRMPDTDGIQATADLIAEFGAAAPKVLVLTTFDLEEAALFAIEAGASGFIVKDTEPEFLLAAIRQVAAGSNVVSSAATRSLFEQFRPSTRMAPGAEYGELTPREREILTHVARGMSNVEIAGELFISEATVKTHVSRILTKLSLRDRVHMVIYAYERALV